MNLVGRRWDGLCIVERLSDALEARFSRSSLSHWTHSSTLQPCIEFDAITEGEFLRGRSLARSFPHNRILDTRLVVYHAKVGNLRSARFIFDGMPEKNVVSWTALISGYSHNGLFKEALETFGLMHREGGKANQLTYGSSLSACSRIGCIRAGLQIQGCVAKSRYTKDLYVNSALVDLHLKYGLVEDAQTLFWGVDYRDTVLWNSMIGGLASRSLTDDTFKFFFLMLKQGKLPDHFTFPSILRACSVTRDVLNIDEIHSMIIKSGLSSHHIVSGSLIDAYVKCSSIPSARLLYDSLLEQDIFPCTTLIAGYSTDRSYSNEAVKLYCKLNQVGVKVDNVIICSMLNVSANESSLELGRQIHACAIKNQLNHDVALQNSLVHMYAKSGELQLAQLAFDEMQTTNVISWTSLIAGYGKHGQVDDVVTLFENMENTG
ncbi:hypothetical protein HPP92_003713 [Vanilla planifolia]|uniref:Pentatricopeptide repeat-containing protein n=1 Tax=Vanilla planifolia TaxID=51239 RepID=A0A835SCF4_VANPL|nr:hypothetical protein HPP92_003713 [Vanilla planifolia]